MDLCDQHDPGYFRRNRLPHPDAMALQDLMLQDAGIFFRYLGVGENAKSRVDAIDGLLPANDSGHLRLACPDPFLGRCGKTSPDGTFGQTGDEANPQHITAIMELICIHDKPFYNKNKWFLPIRPPGYFSNLRRNSSRRRLATSMVLPSSMMTEPPLPFWYFWIRERLMIWELWIRQKIASGSISS